MKSSKNISITMPSLMLRQAEQLAEKEHRTMSELLREALRYYQRERESEEAIRFHHVKARKLGIEAGDVERLIHEYRRETKKTGRSKS